MPQTLWNRGFIALLITQFTVAFNDNVFRWLLIPIGKAYMPSGKDDIRFLGAVCLIIPFPLWASIAGFITDKFSRRNTVIWCKTIELILLAAAIGVISMGPTVGSAGVPAKIWILLGILFLLGSQSAFFSPSKYGLIPDLVPGKSISAANGVIAMLTMLAIVFGQIVGGLVFALTTFRKDILDDAGIMQQVVSGVPGGNNVGITILVLVGTAAIGLLSSFFIPTMKPVDPGAKFPKNPLWQTGKDLAALFSHRALFWVALASAFFWGLGALAQNNIDKYATEYLLVPQEFAMPLAALLTIGIGIGAILCGYFSGKRIELGLVPIGALFMGLFILILGFTPGYAAQVGEGFGLQHSTTPYIFGAVVMFLAGLGAGFYDIPLAAYIQKNSPKEQRGRMIAAYNFCTFSAMLLFAGFGWLIAIVFNSWEGQASLLIWIATGLLTLVVAAALFYVYAAPFMIFFFRTLVRILYRPKFIGTENIPAEGGALLVCNHISLLDGFVLYFACPRNIRYVAHGDMVPKMFECVARKTKLIRILPGSPKNVIQAIRAVREALQNGEIVGIFPEGGITRNGQMKAFEPGFMAMLKGVTAPDGSPIPVIPCHINGLHESMFGYKYGDYTDGKIFRRPRKLISDVIVAFGKPMLEVKYPQQVQIAVQELGVDTYREHNKKRQPIPVRQLIRACKKRGSKLMFADSTGIELNGYGFLTAALALRHLLNKHVLDSRHNEPHVGILAPMSVGGGLLNAAFNLDRRVPVNLNFTFGVEGINYCIQQAGIKHVLTSRRVLERLPQYKTELNAEVICTEDLAEKLDSKTKLTYFLLAVFLPARLHEWKLGLSAKERNDDLMTIVYTSGSTGQPKGVMLTNDNIAEVARGFVGTQRLGKNDVLLGFLPFFHAFGLMGNFWLPIFAGGVGVFHFSPLEPKKVAEMAKKYPITFMPATPTFLRNFYRYCPKEDFAHVPAIICGAEKFPVDMIDAWHKKYAVRPCEGFGATELSPVMATNVPESRVTDTFHLYRKDGSIGRAISNIVVKVVDMETGTDMPPNGTGMIVAKGPTVMKGYYKQPEKTAEVLKDGWYTTGDVGKIDEDGFIWVTGRESRISKIGGEMVPHILIEEEILKILSESDTSDTESNEPMVAVTSLPHSTRGEQLIVLYRDASLSPEKLVERLIASDLPRIWIPRVEGFVKVDSIPVLGTGKLDLAAVKRMALASSNVSGGAAQ